MFATGFAEFLIMAGFSLAVTFVLFSKLESFAQGQSKIAGGTIQYGGALAGFVLVFSLLAFTYPRAFGSEGRTAIDLRGEYTLTQRKQNGDIRHGVAEIHQTRGEARLEITGEVESTTNPPSITFTTEAALLRGRRLIFLYETSTRNMGIALGDIVQDRPRQFRVVYYDALSTDTNADPQGTLVFT